MATSAEFKKLRYFKPSEFEHPESMSCELLVKLDLARGLAGVPFVITSDVRAGSPEHLAGEAVDIRCHLSEYRYRIVQAVLAAGFLRVGVYDGHVHVGVSKERPQFVLWTGVSA